MSKRTGGGKYLAQKSSLGAWGISRGQAGSGDKALGTRVGTHNSCILSIVAFFQDILDTCISIVKIPSIFLCESHKQTNTAHAQ